MKFFYLQDSQDPLANSLLQPQFPGTLVLELDWLPLRADKNDPLVLCIAGADSSFRLIEVNMYVEHILAIIFTFLDVKSLIEYFFSFCENNCVEGSACCIQFFGKS